MKKTDKKNFPSIKKTNQPESPVTLILTNS